VADPIVDAIKENATDGISSNTVDGRTTVAMAPSEQIEADKYAKAQAAAAGTNAGGGPVSLWNRTRAARYIPPGGV
jgi:hypothetical protein